MPTAIARRMTGRDPAEPHRASTPLELFFDLTFVVAIAQCAASLHHGVADGHAAAAVAAYPMVFFAIWWAWMNFTWFASAYDTDDAAYRVAVFCQMAGVLVLAAGVPRAFDDGDFTVVTIGYLVMRVGLVSLWLRAAHDHRDNRPSALRNAASLAVLQAGWLALLLAPGELARAGFVALVALELILSYWATKVGTIAWHPHHIAERYGLFTIIVLGESILSATLGVQSAVDAGEALADIASVVVGGLLIVFAMWWLYFDEPTAIVASPGRGAAAATRRTFLRGYAHYLVFATAAATGAGLAVAIDHATGHATIGDAIAGLAITLPVALYTLTVGALHATGRPDATVRGKLVLVAALVVASSWMPEPVLAAGLVLCVAVVIRVRAERPALPERGAAVPTG